MDFHGIRFHVFLKIMEGSLTLNWHNMHIIAWKEVCGIKANVNAQEIWFNYFNSVLFDKGIISKNEHDKMAQLIRKKCHTPIRGDRKKSLRENC